MSTPRRWLEYTIILSARAIIIIISIIMKYMKNVLCLHASSFVLPSYRDGITRFFLLHCIALHFSIAERVKARVIATSFACGKQKRNQFLAIIVAVAAANTTSFKCKSKTNACNRTYTNSSQAKTSTKQASNHQPTLRDPFKTPDTIECVVCMQQIRRHNKTSRQE